MERQPAGLGLSCLPPETPPLTAAPLAHPRHRLLMGLAAPCEQEQQMSLGYASGRGYAGGNNK